MGSLLDKIHIRKIKEDDELAIATIIRSCLNEFGADKPGTVYFDKTTDHLFSVFQIDRSVYYVAESDDKIVGGGGIFPSPGLPPDTCELVKMYLLKEVRSIGLGNILIQKNLAFAKEAGYKKVYLETMPELKRALKVYEKFGFHYIDHALGDTGHFGCDLWMLKEL